MKGLEIRIGNRMIKAAVNDGSCGVSVSIDSRSGKGDISVGGVDKAASSCLKWYESGLVPGEDFSVTFSEIDAVSDCEEGGMPASGEETLRKAFDIYNSLRQELLDAGLIDD